MASFLLLPAVLPGADLSGRWWGQISLKQPDGKQRMATHLMLLKQSGDTITGTSGPNIERQWPILNGRVKDGQITFDVKVAENHTYRFTFDVKGEEMTGRMTTLEREQPPTTVVAWKQ